jgi:hypothetical protein
MGYIKHNAVIVSGWRVMEAHLKAHEIFKKLGFEQLVSPIINGILNGQDSFFIAPDGSKEGWDTSDECDKARKEFLDWLTKSENYADYIEIRFGGDDEDVTIVRDKDSDLNN